MITDKPPVLYVDDEESNLRIFRTAFKRFYKVYTALSGDEGLEILKTTEVHLIITDQKMPKMTGIEFLERVLPLYPDPIRIILTGFSDVEAIIKAINSGRVYRYITKPWSKNELQITLDKALETYALQQQNKRLIIDLKEANEGLEQKVVERTKEIEQKNSRIDFQRGLLQETNRKITDSIRYAQRLQRSILPNLKEVEEAFADSMVLFRPRDIVSGDFYWFHQTDDKLFFSALDCTGHGVPGAFMSLIGSNALNTAVKIKRLHHPSAILSEMHRIVCEDLKKESGSLRDGMDMSLCVIDKTEQIIRFAGARNGLLVVEENGNDYELIRGSKLSIGQEHERILAVFKTTELPISKDKSYYMFSDGLPDQFGGPRDRKFTRKRLIESILASQDQPMSEQKVSLENDLDNWQGNERQIDDILVTGFRL